MGVTNLIFDFDGVMAESNDIRFLGFEELFRGYPRDVVEEFMTYVKSRGGLSRYAKIIHFYEIAEKRTPFMDEVKAAAGKYSALVKEKVIQAPAVRGAEDFLRDNQGRFGMALVSGSDELELQEVCLHRGIDHFFSHILGSPTEKPENLARLMKLTGWPADYCVYVGDSLDDRLAALAVGMSFIGRNSGLVDWRGVDGVNYLNDLTELSGQLRRLSTKREAARSLGGK